MGFGSAGVIGWTLLFSLRMVLRHRNTDLESGMGSFPRYAAPRPAFHKVHSIDEVERLHSENHMVKSTSQHRSPVTENCMQTNEDFALDNAE